MISPRPTCDVDGCRVPAIGYGRCVQHIAPMMLDPERENTDDSATFDEAAAYAVH